MDNFSVVAGITNSDKGPDSRRRILSQSTAVVYRLLVAVVMGELCFKAYSSTLIVIPEQV
jgi:hypothetical protein